MVAGERRSAHNMQTNDAEKCKVDDNKLFAINNEGIVIEKYLTAEEKGDLGGKSSILVTDAAALDNGN